MTKILGMKDALEGLKIIVILPDHDPEMITRVSYPAAPLSHLERTKT